MNNRKTQNSPGGKSAHSNAALERSVKNMKMIIAGLSVALAACIVYIVITPTESSQPENPVNYGYPAAASPEVDQVPVQVEPEVVTSPPAGAVQSPPPGTATPTPNPTSSAPAPAGQQTGKLNPPHGQPGHRCDIPVGNVLP